MDHALHLLALTVVLYLGFATLALSQVRNWRLVIAASPPSPVMKIVLRAIGIVLLMLAIPLALWLDGPSFGSLMWGTAISVAACAVTATLSWCPHWLRPLARAIRAANMSQIVWRLNE